tara:strand:- start:3256 stop:3666 length:411 start_codon:yes stop_codon:yes gene_type:complete
VAKENPYHMDIQGVAAELAFAKHYNLYPPLDVGIRHGTADFEMNGRSIDVKQSDYSDARLIVPPYKLEEGRASDSYVLVTGVLPELVLRGHARKEDLHKSFNLVKLRSIVYALTIDQLRPMPKRHECTIRTNLRGA